MSYYLSEDLIAEILQRLPAKSLIRFRSVSKSWSSRISDPCFIRTHALRSAKTRQKVIVRQRNHHTKYIETSYSLYPEDRCTGTNPVEFPWENFRIIGSCNGIICLYEKKCNNRSIILWNPSIRRKLTVPKHHNGNIAIGFGFDTMTNDYKIVGVCCSKYAVVACIYSLKTNTWSEIAYNPSPMAIPDVIFVPIAYLFNQTLHWMVEFEYDDFCLMTFDFKTRVFGMISLPEREWETIQPTIIKGSLAMISRNHDNSWIWVRRECNNVASWSKDFNLTSIGFGLDCVSNHDDMLSNNYLEDFEGYNPETGVRSRLVGFADSSYIIDMDMCVESLELFDKDKC